MSVSTVLEKPVLIVTSGLSLVGLIVFITYLLNHWNDFIGETNSIVLWSIGTGALLVYLGLAYVAVKILVSLLHGLTTAYGKYAEARMQVLRGNILHVSSDIVVTLKDGQPYVQFRSQHRADTFVAEEKEEQKLLPEKTFPSTIRYEDIKDLIPEGHTLVGLDSRGIVTREDTVKALIWIVGSSESGKTNSTAIRVEEDFNKGHKFLVVDPHAGLKDSLSESVKPYASAFLLPIAKTWKDIHKVLTYFLEEFYNRRDNNGNTEVCITLIVDEVGSLMFEDPEDADTPEEETLIKEVKRLLRKIARKCGTESRKLRLTSMYISQDAAHLKWLRDKAVMVIAHQLTMMSERVLACNQDTSIARSMDKWPKGRTLIYGIGFTEGPNVYQQPKFTPRVVDASETYEEYHSAQTEDLEDDNDTPESLPIPSGVDIYQRAQEALQNGVKGPRELARALEITYYQAQKITSSIEKSQL